jgi:hypothetical protein
LIRKRSEPSSIEQVVNFLAVDRGALSREKSGEYGHRRVNVEGRWNEDYWSYHGRSHGRMVRMIHSMYQSGVKLAVRSQQKPQYQVTPRYGKGRTLMDEQ